MVVTAPKCKICGVVHWGLEHEWPKESARKALPAPTARAPETGMARRYAAKPVGERMADDERVKRQSRAQAAAGLVPAGREAIRVEVRFPEDELAYLDEIRGAFSRADMIRVLVRGADRIGVGRDA